MYGLSFCRNHMQTYRLLFEISFPLSIAQRFLL
nr:MAG TPA: hypothetical protein [Caudoviricetes sp.]